jgi:hypothetical protein
MTRYIEERTEDERKVRRWVRWPHSFADGNLPWEASRAVLDLIAYEHPHRPTIAEALDFWRFTQAAPDAPVEFRAESMRQFRSMRVLDGRTADGDRMWERILAFKEWEKTTLKKGKVYNNPPKETKGRPKDGKHLQTKVEGQRRNRPRK